MDLFFVLSGFLIGGILLDSRESNRYYKTFYIRRAYRILPVYLVVITIYWLVSWISVSVAAGNSIPFFAYAAFVQNFWMASMGGFGAAALAVTWSLAIEEQFYLVAPLVVRRLNVRKLTIVLALIVVIAPLSRAIFLSPHVNCLGAYVLMPCRADALCLGMLCAIAKRNQKIWDFVVRRRRYIFYSFLVFLGGAASLAVAKLPFCSGIMITVGFSILGFLYATLLLLSMIGPTWLIRLLERSTLRGLGKISYAVYLFHLPFIIECRTFLAFQLHHFGFAGDLRAEALVPGAVLGIVLAIAAAMISYAVFEGPILRLGHRYEY